MLADQESDFSGQDAEVFMRGLSEGSKLTLLEMRNSVYNHCVTRLTALRGVLSE